MNTTIFFLTWFVLSAALQLYNNHKLTQRINKVHKLNKQIKGDK